MLEDVPVFGVNANVMQGHSLHMADDITCSISLLSSSSLLGPVFYFTEGLNISPKRYIVYHGQLQSLKAAVLAEHGVLEIF